MAYELSIGWRYLYAGKRDKWMIVCAALSALMALSGEMATKFDEVSKDAGPHMQAMKDNASLWRELGGVLAKAKAFDKREGMPGVDDKAQADLQTKRKELTS